MNIIATCAVLTTVVMLHGCTVTQVDFGPDYGRDYIYTTNTYGFFPAWDNTRHVGFGFGTRWGNRYYWNLDANSWNSRGRYHYWR